MKSLDFGKGYHLHEIENAHLILRTTDFGAAVVSIIDKKTGIDILCGFDDAEGYINNPGPHTGGFIGRTANRTRGAQFTINGKTYHIEPNEGKNNLHGGNEGFNRVKYECELKEDEIIYHRISKDGEMGYPGNLDVRISYRLDENKIKMNVQGTTDQDTVFCWTNHNYYNLDGSDTIENHEVTIYAERYANNGEDGCSDGELKPVEGTVFDFHRPKKLGEDMNGKDPQIILAKGFDHHFSVDGSGMRKFAECKGEKLRLIVNSDLPGMHMYTGNYIDVIGKGGKHFIPHGTVCFEPEYYPNAINYEAVEPKPLLKAGETSNHSIEWIVENI